MEKEVKEADKPKEPKLIVKNPNWLDLPNPIATNIILEQLEIDDYIRFSAVCKEWQLIQKEHRIIYSPYPPPLALPFPWLFSCPVNNTNVLYPSNEDKRHLNILDEQNNYFYIANKGKLYDIPFRITRKILWTTYCHGHGWFLLLLSVDNFHWCLCISNPITRVQIELPPIMLKKDPCTMFRTMLISSPPSDRDCTILIMFHECQVYLCRLNDNNGWKVFHYSNEESCRIAFFNNKIYDVSGFCDKICIVDTLLPNPVEQVFEMDRKIDIDEIMWESLDLVNLLGELVIIKIKLQLSGRLSYKLYRADFLTNKWERMRSLGDHALFYSEESSFLLSVIDVGCKKNTIYYGKREQWKDNSWTSFDLSTKKWTDGPPWLSSTDFTDSVQQWSWFLPTLDYFNASKASEA